MVRAAHTAARLTARNFPEPERRSYQAAALQEAASHGYVAIAEMSAPHICGPEDLRMAASWNEHRYTPEVLPYWGELATSQEHAQAILDGLGTKVLGLAGDLNMDGSIGSRTAALMDDYSDAPGPTRQFVPVG